jgi:hypothetical protein
MRFVLRFVRRALTKRPCRGADRARAQRLAALPERAVRGSRTARMTTASRNRACNYKKALPPIAMRMLFTIVDVG